MSNVWGARKLKRILLTMRQLLARKMQHGSSQIQLLLLES